MFRTTAARLRPKVFARPTPCGPWTVAQVVHHVTLTQLYWIAEVSGTYVDGPGWFPRAEIGTSASRLVDPAFEAFKSIWSVVDTQTELRTRHGAISVRDAAALCALETVIHCWDVAVATGQPSPLSAAIVEQLPSARRFEFGPAGGRCPIAGPLPPQPTDGPVERLLRSLGREPDWRAT